MHTIRLTEPQDGSVTNPLPAFTWDMNRKKIKELSRPAIPKEVIIDWGDNKTSTEKDYTFPTYIRFVWNFKTAYTDILYNFYLSEEYSFSDITISKEVSVQQYQLKNLKVNTTYYWKVEAVHNNKIVARSPISSFKTDTAMPRWIEVPDTTNFRDMGGWPLENSRAVKQGILYRCSELNGHIQITEEGKKILIDNLKIRTDLDLRGEFEPVSPVLDRNIVNWINIPVLPYDNILKDEQKENYRRIFTILADEKNYPLIFHCWGGCDRGGTLAFLIHALLGVEEKYLFLDYELSSLSIWGNRECSSQFFQSLLKSLKRFGPDKNYRIQSENYLKEIGVSKNEIDKIRKMLTD
jgi:protein tyrosine/serine phosphatase